MTKLNQSRARRAALAILTSVVFASCSQVPPPSKPPLTQQRPLTGFLKAAAYPNSDTLVVLVTMAYWLWRYHRRPISRNVAGISVPEAI